MQTKVNEDIPCVRLKCESELEKRQPSYEDEEGESSGENIVPTEKFRKDNDSSNL